MPRVSRVSWVFTNTPTVSPQTVFSLRMFCLNTGALRACFGVLSM